MREEITGLMAARGRKDNGEINREEDVKQIKDCDRPGRPYSHMVYRRQKEETACTKERKENP